MFKPKVSIFVKVWVVSVIVKQDALQSVYSEYHVAQK